MEYINTILNTPEENISFDEFLLNEAEEGQRSTTLRFWELKKYTVVLGRGCSVFDDVFIDNCKKDNIKIIQRSSGGGTVILGQGCLNYSLILPYSNNTALLNIKNSFKYILYKLIEGFGHRGINLNYEPVSDLVIDNKKVSGNAQARRKKFLLHHGTFLYDFDINRLSYYLKKPKKAPEYRKDRPHKNFLANLSLSSGEIKKTIKNAFLF